MAAREPQLPEGTDHIVTGAGEPSRKAASGGGTRGRSGKDAGFVASGGDSDTSGVTDKLASQVREQVSTIRGQAGDKLRAYADDGKGKATGLLDDVSAVVEDAARSVDQRFGEEYGEYAHKAARAVSSFAGKIREKSVDDLMEDTRSLVRKSPAVALGAAAVVGFMLMRVVRTGMEDVGAAERGGRRKSSGGGD
jgi:ElaB/YqjD/DUF883 family membrane-anchored ribosome-binding protein